MPTEPTTPEPTPGAYGKVVAFDVSDDGNPRHAFVRMHVGTPALGVVIGLAIVCNLVAGALGGILIPMVLEKVKADPAVASGTFVTTITDVVGFFSFLGIATLWFGLN